MKDDPYMCPITIDSSTSQETNINEPLILLQTQFKTENLTNVINKIAPNTGRIKTLAILYLFMRQSVRIPHINSAKRLIRNESILRQYRVGKTYSELAQEFTISER